MSAAWKQFLVASVILLFAAPALAKEHTGAEHPKKAKTAFRQNGKRNLRVVGGVQSRPLSVDLRHNVLRPVAVVAVRARGEARAKKRGSA